MNEQLQAVVLESIDELDPNHGLPRSEKNKIAYDTVLEEKVMDGEWLYQRIQYSKKELRRKRNVALIRGYEPFTCLNKRIYFKLLDTFGHDTLDLMRSHLADPEDIYPKWGYRFARAVRDIGIEDCKKHGDDLYVYVTNHPCWASDQEEFSQEFSNWLAIDARLHEKHEEISENN